MYKTCNTGILQIIDEVLDVFGKTIIYFTFKYTVLLLAYIEDLSEELK